MRLSSTIFEL